MPHRKWLKTNRNQSDAFAMKMRFKVIAEHNDGHWSAMFEAIPHIKMRGRWRYEAIERLLDFFGRELFDEDGTMALHHATTATRLELLIPIAKCRVLRFEDSMPD